jgi:hypothetical protein
VNALSAVGVPSGPGTLVSVQTGSTLPTHPQRASFIGPAPISRQDVKKARIAKADQTATKGTVLDPGKFRRAFVRQVQAALCVPTDERGDGDENAATKLAIQTYLNARNKTPPTNIDVLTNNPWQGLLQDAVDQVQDCAAKGFESAYEVGAFGVPSGATVDRIKGIQAQLNEKLLKNAINITVDINGTFDANTRGAIEELRVRRNLPAGRFIDHELEKYLFSVGN